MSRIALEVHKSSIKGSSSTITSYDLSLCEYVSFLPRPSFLHLCLELVLDHGFGHAYDLIKNPSFVIRFNPKSKRLKPYFEKIDWSELDPLPHGIRIKAREILDSEKRCRERRAIYAQYILAKSRENSGEWASLKGIEFSPSSFILKKAHDYGYDISAYLISKTDFKSLGRLIIYVR